MKNKSVIFILFMAILSCKKSNDSNVVLNGTLTNCPANSTCTYNYFDNADFTSSTNGDQPVSGNFRVFWYKSVNGYSETALYFKTSLGNSSFDLTSSQIKTGGLLKYFFSCPSCDYIAVHPLSGEIKGKRTGLNSWLINATVVLAGDISNKPIDTLAVNQYFTQ